MRYLEWVVESSDKFDLLCMFWASGGPAGGGLRPDACGGPTKNMSPLPRAHSQALFVSGSVYFMVLECGMCAPFVWLVVWILDLWQDLCGMCSRLLHIVFVTWYL